MGMVDVFLALWLFEVEIDVVKSHEFGSRGGSLKAFRGLNLLKAHVSEACGSWLKFDYI